MFRFEGPMRKDWIIAPSGRNVKGAGSEGGMFGFRWNGRRGSLLLIVLCPVLDILVVVVGLGG